MSDIKNKLESQSDDVVSVAKDLSTLLPTPNASFVNLITQLSVEEREDLRRVFGLWLSIHDRDILNFTRTLIEVFHSFNLRKKQIRERVESSAYVSLVKLSMSHWVIAGSDEKRVMIRNLLSNAALLNLSPDSALEQFIDWIDEFTVDHFQILKALKSHEHLSRKEIWLKLKRDIPAEDSAIADMYRAVLADLSLTQLIRQKREKDYFGSFVKASKVPKDMSRRDDSENSNTHLSIFDNSKKYVLTELGKQFSQYAFNKPSGLS